MRPLGSLLLPRSKQANVGSQNWPKCALCKRSVDAYGIENETDARIEIWIRCDGVYRDPKTGLAVGLAARVHEPRKTSVTLFKGPGWSANRFTDLVSRTVVFHPEGLRQWLQTITREGARPRE